MIVIKSLLLIVSLSAAPTAASAFCFDEAAAAHGLSPALLRTVAAQENDRADPAAVNWNGDGSYDYGVMQINSWWAGVLGTDRWAALGDPCYNVNVGAWILAQCIQRYGNTWRAVGCYNARSEEKRARYAWRIHGALRRGAAGAR